MRVPRLSPLETTGHDLTSMTVPLLTPRSARLFRAKRHVPHPLSRYSLMEGRRHPESIVPGKPSSLQMAPLQHLQRQLRLRPVALPFFGTPAAAHRASSELKLSGR